MFTFTKKDHCGIYMNLLCSLNLVNGIHWDSCYNQVLLAHRFYQKTPTKKYFCVDKVTDGCSRRLHKSYSMILFLDFYCNQLILKSYSGIALCLKISISLREVFIVSYYIFDYGPGRFQEYLVKSCRWKYRNCPIKLSCYVNPIKLASYKIQSIDSKSIDLFLYDGNFGFEWVKNLSF